MTKTLEGGITRTGEGFAGTEWNILGQRYFPKASCASTFAFETNSAPGQFVPVHIHPHQDEFILVQEGQLELKLDGQWQTARAGDLVRMPRGVPHGYFNKSDAPCRALFWVSPAGRLERALRDAARDVRHTGDRRGLGRARRRLPAARGERMSGSGAVTDFAKRMSYGDYLGLDAILTAQRPLSTANDELLFIIQHQTSELWMKLAIHELDAARAAIATGRLDEAQKLLARVSRIFEQLNNAWDVLRTMTPSDYTEFREALGQSSGFQSAQYRRIEFVLGNRNRAMLKPHAHRPELVADLEAELARPDLYAVALAAAARAGLAVPDAALAVRAEPARPTRASSRCGPRSTATRAATGRSTSSRRSSSTSRTTSAAGASTTSPPSSG